MVSKKVCVAKSLFIPVVMEARAPWLSHRSDPTADNADAEKTPQPKVLWTFVSKMKSLMLMHHIIPFNFISGDRLRIPSCVWSLVFRAAVTCHEPLLFM